NNWKGIYFNNLNNTEVGTSIIENCRFDYANKMDMDYQGGGAIAIYNSDNVVIKHSLFYANSARYGGAMYIEDSDPHIEDCYFELNGKEIGQTSSVVTTAGGALYIRKSNPFLHKLQFINNYSISGGGAVVVDNSSFTISNVLFAKNETEGMGGAIEVLSNINSSLLKVVNMTSVDNVSKNNGGGTFHIHGDNTELEVVNSIMYGNTKVEVFNEGKTPIVTYSIIDGASSEVYFGEGCLDVDPYLVTGTVYRLANNSCNYSNGSNDISPAIDAGHPDSLDVKLDCKEGLGTSRADMGYYGGRYTNTQILGIDDGIDNSSSKYILDQNHPNPFSLTTSISFTLPKSGLVSLKVYNILGEEISTLINKEMDKGVNSIVFDASSLSSGIYFYQISVDDFKEIKRMIIF
ncbi:MAG: T9SS type A sorting domain-containing protein, partial [Flavobacteriales bacterium]|nr:T9SS type A sorting domain-containing protein [Flavobacteriales bacterium]